MRQDCKQNWMNKRKMIKPVMKKRRTQTRDKDANDVGKARRSSSVKLSLSNNSNSKISTTMASIGRKISNLLSRVLPESTSAELSRRLSMTIIL